MINYKVVVGVILVMSSFMIENAHSADWGICIFTFKVGDNPSDLYDICYQNISIKECDKHKVGDIIHIPLLKKTLPIFLGPLKVFYSKTCKDYYVGEGIPIHKWELIATLSDDALEAKLIGHGQGVQLNLTTLAEEDISTLSIYRAIKVDSGKLQQPVKVCSWFARGNLVSGSVYSCVDKAVLSGTFLYWPVDINSNGIDTHHIDKAVEVNLGD